MKDSFEQKLKYLKAGALFRFKDTTNPNRGVYECITLGEDPRNNSNMMYIKKNFPQEGVKTASVNELVLGLDHGQTYERPRVTTAGSLFCGTIFLVMDPSKAMLSSVRSISRCNGEVTHIMCDNDVRLDATELVRILWCPEGIDFRRMDECYIGNLIQIRDSRLSMPEYQTYSLHRTSWVGSVQTRYIKKYDYNTDSEVGDAILVHESTVVKRVMGYVGQNKHKGYHRASSTPYIPPPPLPPLPEPVFEDIVIETQMGSKVLMIEETPPTCAC